MCPQKISSFFFNFDDLRARTFITFNASQSCRIKLGRELNVTLYATSIRRSNCGQIVKRTHCNGLQHLAYPPQRDSCTVGNIHWSCCPFHRYQQQRASQ